MGETITKVCERCGKEYQSDAWRESKPRYRRKACSVKCGRYWPSPMERFWRYVRKAGPDECWIWFGPAGNWGYGQIYYKGRRHYCHKWAYEHFVGPVPDGKILMHSCDTPACVNTNHLSIGTLKENSQDCLNKGRKKTQKLNPEKVREIRRHFGGEKGTWKEYEVVGNKYGVKACVIHGVVVGRNWSWVSLAAEGDCKDD